MPRTKGDRVNTVTDWNGQLLRKKVLNHLEIEDIVRIQFRIIDKDGNLSKCGSVCYVQIYAIKGKHGSTYWGRAIDAYDQLDFLNIKLGQKFTFRKESIIEYPLSWQGGKKRRNMLETYLVPDKGRGVTGVFGLNPF